MTAIFWLLILASVIVKLVAAQLLAWEADYVPLISRGADWLDGGAFPAVGTLSSVAAFNLPFLVWMQLPALVITRHIPTVLIGTQLAFNLLATVALWRLGRELFDDRAGMIAALLFTFSEVGVSSAYTAWAQLLLPGFCALFFYCLFRWQVDRRARYVALTWLLATAAFMTHFSAVLLYGVLAAWWLILRLPWNARGLLAGVGASILMLAPYMAFEAQNDFIDLRAFFTRSHRIDAETLADYAHLKPGGQVAAPSEPTPANDDAPPRAQPSSSRLQRGIDYALSVPGQAISALRMSFQGELQTLQEHAPGLALLARGLQLALELCFWIGGGFALYRGLAELARMAANPGAVDRLAGRTGAAALAGHALHSRRLAGRARDARRQRQLLRGFAGLAVHRLRLWDALPGGGSAALSRAYFWRWSSSLRG